MFFDNDLRKCRYLGKVWKIANNIEDGSDEDIDMPNICNNIDSWIDNHYEVARKRLSLRTSSVLVSGAARLYKRKIQQLYEDTLQLDTEVTFRKKSRYSTDNYSVLDGSPTFTEDSDDICDTAHDISTNDDTRSHHLSAHCSRSRLIQRDTCNSGMCSGSNDSRELEPPIRVDKSIQVSPAIQPDASFDQNLPFGYIVIHDNFKDRIPSRILFSSLNLDVNKLG